MFIISLFIQLIIAIFIIRFHLSFYQLGFNPVISKIHEFTDPLILPFRRIPIFNPTRQMQYRSNPLLAKILRYDIPALIVGFLISFLIGILFWHSFTAALLIFVLTWLNLIYYAIFITIIGSWLSADPQQPIMQIALSCSEWLLEPLRRIIPPLGMFDISPIIPLIILSILIQGISVAL